MSGDNKVDVVNEKDFKLVTQLTLNGKHILSMVDMDESIVFACEKELLNYNS